MQEVALVDAGRRNTTRKAEASQQVGASAQRECPSTPFLGQQLTLAQLYYRRLSVAHAYAPLRRHIPVLMALGVAGMSSDESDHSNGVAQYGVFQKEWRAKRITTWLRVFDSLYRRLRMNETNKNTPGSQPHTRFYSAKSSARRPPVKGLPHNAYDTKWLQGLHMYDRKQLRVQEVEYAFKHDPELLKCVLPSAILVGADWLQAGGGLQWQTQPSRHLFLNHRIPPYHAHIHPMLYSIENTARFQNVTLIEKHYRLQSRSFDSTCSLAPYPVCNLQHATLYVASCCTRLPYHSLVSFE